MNLDCKECGANFPDSKSLHAHLRSHKIKTEAYYLKHFPKVDLFTGAPLVFKDAAQYLRDDFNDKKNLKLWFRCQKNPVKLLFIQHLLLDRKKEKGLVYAPCQVEMRSAQLPLIQDIEDFTNYYKLTESLGFSNKYCAKIPVVGVVPEPNHVVVDTREQQPLNLTCETVRAKLDFGDYFLSASKWFNCYIERKSLGDFIGTLSPANLDRFTRELERAAKSNFVILVEASLSKALMFHEDPWFKNYSKVRPEYIFRHVRDLIQKFPNIQFLFVDGRKEAARVALKLLRGNGFADIDLQLAYERQLL